MKRIAIGGFFHESNNISPLACTARDFIIFEGDELYQNKQAYPLAGGMLDYFEGREDVELILLNFARAVPNGEVEQELYHRLKGRFFALLDKAERPDLFLLPLHGSMRVKDIGSAETDLLKEIEKRYPKVPIICGLDMHATVTKEMLKLTEALVGFKTAPHIDARETGQAAAKMADKLLFEDMKLTMAAVKLPYLIAGEKSETSTYPMRELIDELFRIEAEPGVISASYLLGFPWAKALENGVCSIVITENDQAKADSLARHLTDKFVSYIDEFSFAAPAFEPEEALLKALAEVEKPVFVSDSGDNPTAGSTADNTTIIELLSGKLKDKCKGKRILIAGIFDQAFMAEYGAKVGTDITALVGGKWDKANSRPVELKGRIEKYIASFGAYRSHLSLLKTDEFELILTSEHIGFTTVEMFKALELSYLNYDIIIVKLGYLTPDFKDIAKKHYMALTRGCTDQILGRLGHDEKFIPI